MAETPDHLDVLADELLRLCQPAPSYGPDRARWERNARGVIARIFRLGMASGWDKAVAALDGSESPRPEPGALGPALVSADESGQLATRLEEMAEVLARMQRGAGRGGGYPRRVAMAELSQVRGSLDAAGAVLRGAG